MKSKSCTKCDITKPLSEFYESHTIKEGYQYWCKECDKAYHRLRYSESPATYIKRTTAYRKAHPKVANQWVRKYSKTEKGKLTRNTYMTKYKKSAHGKLVIKAINRRAYLRKKLLKGVK